MSEAKIVLSAEDRTRAAFESAKAGLTDLHTKAVAVSGAMAAIGATAFLTDMVSGIHGAIEEWDELGKAAQRAGVASAQTMAELQFGAKLAGVEAANLEQAIGKLAGKMADAVSGNKDAAATFKALNIEIKDTHGHLRATEDVLSDLAQKFSEFKDSPEKSALAIDLFGKSGKELIPLLNGGADGLSKVREEFRQLRGVLDDRTIKAAEEVNDNLTKLETNAGGLKRALAQDMLPALVQITDAMVEQAKKGGVLQTVWAGLVESAKQLAGFDPAKAKAAQLSLLEESLRVGGDSPDGKLAAMIAQQRAQLAGLKAGPDGTVEGGTGTFARLDRQTPLVTAPVVAKPSSTASQASAYDAAVKSIKERLALQKQELAAGHELTEAEKFETKVLADLSLSKEKVSETRMGEVKAMLDELKAGELQQKARKSALEDAMVDAKERQRIRAEEYEAAKELARQEAEQEHKRNVAAAEMLDQIEFETKLLSMNTEQREVAIATRELEKQGIVEGTTAWAQYGQAIQEAAAKRAQAQQTIQQFEDIWGSIDSTAHSVWNNIEQGGVGTFRRLTDTLKSTLWDALYQMTVRPFLIRLVASVTGQSIPASLASSLGGGGFGGGGGNIMNLLGGGSGLTNGLASAASSLGFTNFAAGLSGVGGSFASSIGAGLATDALGATVAEGAAAATLGTTGAALGSSLAAAIPYVGWAIAAGSLLSSAFGGKRGGPKTENGAGFGVRQAGNVAGTFSTIKAVQSQYENLAKVIGGGTAGTLDLGIFSAADPQGTALTQLDVQAALNGKQIYSRGGRLGGIENVGRSDADLQAALSSEIQRVTLKALQASGFKNAIGDYLRDLGNIDALSDGAVTESLAKVQKAADERAQLEAQILALTTTQEEQLAKARQDEIDAIDDTNKALLTRRNLLQDESKAAASLAVVIANARQGAADFQQFMSGVTANVRQYLDHLNATPDGLLSPEQQLANAKAQFDTQMHLASLGDRTALQNITGYADQLISAQVGYSASGGSTADVIQSIKTQLANLPGLQSDAEYLASVTKDAAANQVAAVRDAKDKIFEGLWGAAGMLATHFDEIDLDKSGSLSVDEMAALLGPIASDSTLRDLIASADQNKDATVSKLEAIRIGIAELAEQSTAAAAPPPQAPKQFFTTDPRVQNLTPEQFDSAAYLAANKDVAAAVSRGETTAYKHFQRFGRFEQRNLGFAPPGFAAGGDHMGGLRMVGERGRELEYTPPSRIYSNADTERILTKSDPALLAEIRALRAEMAGNTRVSAAHASEDRQTGRAIAEATRKMAEAAQLDQLKPERV